MRIQDILATGAPLQLVVDAMDLKEFFLNWKEEMVQKPQKEESPLLTPAEVTEKYRVSKVTLWRWTRWDCWLLSRWGASHSIVSQI